MKVLEFAFDEENSPFLPENYIENCVAYTGTHDNDTFYSFLSSDNNREKVEKYLNMQKNSKNEEIMLETIRKLYESLANIVIINPQDLLMEGNHKRFNAPGTTMNNWQYCASNRLYSKSNVEFLKELSIDSRRG